MSEGSNCIHIGKKPNHKEIKEASPLSPKGKIVVNDSIDAMGKIFRGESDRKIWIVGPCSIDFEDSVLEYAEYLSELREKYRDSIEIVMRFYTGKPRTVGGWKGMQNSKPGEEPNIGQGLINSRSLAIQIIEKYGLPLADEMLHPKYIKSFDDIYSYLAIGARSTSNQEHREISSSLDMPVGFKNPESGDLSIMVNSIKAGQIESVYTIGEDVYMGKGNELSHGILRGSTFEGERASNFDKDSLRRLYKYMMKTKPENPSFIVDTNHENSGKDPSKQLGIMEEVISNLKDLEDSCPGISGMFKGFMTESYIHEGRQDYNPNSIQKGKSLTDPCSSIDDTKEMAKFLSGVEWGI